MELGSGGNYIIRTFQGWIAKEVEFLWVISEKAIWSFHWTHFLVLAFPRRNLTQFYEILLTTTLVLSRVSKTNMKIPIEYWPRHVLNHLGGLFLGISTDRHWQIVKHHSLGSIIDSKNYFLIWNGKKRCNFFINMICPVKEFICWHTK